MRNVLGVTKNGRIFKDKFYKYFSIAQEFVLEASYYQKMWKLTVITQKLKIHWDFSFIQVDLKNLLSQDMYVACIPDLIY